MSPVYDCTSESGRAEGVAKAVEAVRDGLVVVIPTDTVYGIGADAFSSDAVSAVLAAKGRGRDMPPPVLVPNVRTVDGLATDVPPWARDLIRAFWPGPLTLVFKAQSSLMWDLGETNGTVALRMPKDDVALEVLAEVGPMAVTSANQTGQPPATTITEAAAQLGAAVAVYLDAGRRADNVPSTIVDCTGEQPVILREGALSEADLTTVLDTHFPPEAAASDEGVADRAEETPTESAPAEGSAVPTESAPAEGSDAVPTERAPAEGSAVPTERAPAEGSAVPTESAPAEGSAVPTGRADLETGEATPADRETSLDADASAQEGAIELPADPTRPAGEPQ